MISAVIFDMDGLLIDSEPLWRIAEVKVFGSLGVPITEEKCAQTMGLRLDEVVRFWHERHPWDNFDVELVSDSILDEMEAQLAANATPMNGAISTIKFFEDRPVKLGLATSSYMRLVNVILPALGIAEKFQAVKSAQFEKRGKPHPDVFLSAASELEVDPVNCLVFEDSPFGVEAALSAGMRCVSVPEELNRDNSSIHRADLVLESLEEFSELHWSQLNGL